MASEQRTDHSVDKAMELLEQLLRSRLPMTLQELSVLLNHLFFCGCTIRVCVRNLCCAGICQFSPDFPIYEICYHMPALFSRAILSP